MIDGINRSPEDAFPEHTQWFGYTYEIVAEYARGFEDEPVEEVRIIKPVAGSSERRFDLVKRPDPGYGATQFYDAQELGRWPHEDLARLNLEDEDEILRFVNTWGLLGLWNITGYKEWIPFSELLAGKGKDLDERPIFGDKVSKWYGDVRPQLRQEPIPVFRTAAWKYQEWVKKIVSFADIPDAARRRQAESEIILGFFAEKNDVPEWESPHNLTIPGFIQATNGGVIPLPVWDEGRQKWSFGWQYRSLLEAIYFATFLDLVERKDRAGGLKRCGNERCQQLFLAATPHQKYCSKLCEKAQTMRVLRRKKKESEE